VGSFGAFLGGRQWVRSAQLPPGSLRLSQSDLRGPKRRRRWVRLVHSAGRRWVRSAQSAGRRRVRSTQSVADRGGFDRRHWLRDRYDRPNEAEDRSLQRRYIATGVIRAIDRSVSLEDCTKMSAFFRRLHGSFEGCRVSACALFERSVQSSKVGLVQNKESSMGRSGPTTEAQVSI
jgi:hypothetical protein